MDRCVIEAEALRSAYIFLVNLLALMAIYLIVNLSLELEYGKSGIPNFGKVLSVAAGAFVAGSIPGRILGSLFNVYGGISGITDPVVAECIRGLSPQKPTILERMDYIEDNVVIVTCVNRVLYANPVLSVGILLMTLLVAAAVGAALGLVASYPALRLKEDYLAMTLLAFGEFLTAIGYYSRDIVGGTLGVSVVDPFGWVGGELRFLAATLIIAAVAGLIVLYVRLVSRSPLGRALRAMRDQEVAAEVLGKDTVALRRNVLMVSSAIAAIGGSLWAFYAGGVIATAYDRVTWTFLPWVMVILGGAGNEIGVLLGTSVYVTARMLIDQYKGLLEPVLPFSVVWLDRLLMGVVLILILLARPQGILPERPVYPLGRARIRKIVEAMRSRSSS
ncbi:MAG: branched-chain amino acid ABC transporter permease [Nitrososphaerota archaeon]